MEIWQKYIISVLGRERILRRRFHYKKLFFRGENAVSLKVATEVCSLVQSARLWKLSRFSHSQAASIHTYKSWLVSSSISPCKRKHPHLYVSNNKQPACSKICSRVFYLSGVQRDFAERETGTARWLVKCKIKRWKRLNTHSSHALWMARNSSFYCRVAM